MTKSNTSCSGIKRKRPTVKEYLKERFRDIPFTVIMALFAAFCIGSIIQFIVVGRYRDIYIGLAYLAIGAVFYLGEYTLNVRAPIGYTVLMVLFIVFCYLGASYNLYGIIPVLDDILHGVWGIVFSILGIAIIKSLLGAPKTVKGVVAQVLFGVGFAMLLSVMWEIYEFSGDRILHNMDMQQDTIVTHFQSYLLYGIKGNGIDNLHSYEVNGIIRTIIQLADGSEVIIEGGYLELGLIDTMFDLIFCFATTVVFSVALLIDWCKGKYIYRFMIPALLGETFERIDGKYVKVEEDTPFELQKTEAEAVDGAEQAAQEEKCADADTVKDEREPEAQGLSEGEENNG